MPPISLRHFPCDLCGSDNQTLLFTKKGSLTGLDFPLVRCGCGFIFFNQRFDESGIRDLYDEKYYHGHGFDPTADYCDIEDVIGHEDTISAIKELVPPPALLLDFGCGLGKFMAHASKQGYQCEGYELSDFARTFARGTGATVYDSLEAIPSGKYDIVTAVEVLEHCHSPRTVLEAISRSLKPGGWFYYRTENFDGWHESYNDRRDNYIFPEGHIHFFTTPVINRYFAAVGLTSISFSRKSYLKGGRLYKLLARLQLVSGGDYPRSVLETAAWQFGNWIGYSFNIKPKTLPLGRRVK